MIHVHYVVHALDSADSLVYRVVYPLDREAATLRAVKIAQVLTLAHDLPVSFKLRKSRR